MTDATIQEISDAIWPDPEAVPSREIECRHCGQANRVLVPRAVLTPDKYACGSCDEKLFLTPDQPLTGLDAHAYEHPLDRTSLSALKAIPGFPALVRFVLKNLTERTLHIQCLSEKIQCTDDQFPELFRMMETARASLDVPYEPLLFLGQSPHMNAMTMGVEKPVIIMHSAILDQMNDAELTSVLGHELGHLHADHVLYRTVAILVILGGAAMSGIVRLMSWPIQKALLKWSRCSELTGDRAGLLAARDFAASMTVHLRLAGGHSPGTSERTKIRLAPFIDQARRLQQMEAESWLDSFVSGLLDMDRTHPAPVWRVMHLIQWVENGNYLDILAGHYQRTEASTAATD